MPRSPSVENAPHAAGSGTGVTAKSTKYVLKVVVVALDGVPIKSIVEPLFTEPILDKFIELPTISEFPLIVIEPRLELEPPLMV